jgi:hypothetical protein
MDWQGMLPDKNPHCAVVAVLLSLAKLLNDSLKNENHLLPYQEFPCCCLDFVYWRIRIRCASTKKSLPL